MPDNIDSVYAARFTSTWDDHNPALVDFAFASMKYKPLHYFERWDEPKIISQLNILAVGQAGREELRPFFSSERLHGRYIVLILPLITGMEYEDAEEIVVASANCLRLFFGDDFARDRHHAGRYTRSETGWKWETTRRGRVGLQRETPFSMLVDGHTETYSVYPKQTAHHFYDLSVRERDDLGQKFILLWTALEAQLYTDGQDSGESRKGFCKKLSSTIIDAEIYRLFKRRCNYLKEGNRSDVTIHDCASLARFFAICCMIDCGIRRELVRAFEAFISQSQASKP